MERLAVRERRTRSWSWRMGTALVASIAFLLPVFGAGGAAAGTDGKEIVAYVPSTLLASAQEKPKQSFDVIVQGTSNTRTTDVEAAVAAAVELDGDAPAWGKRFQSIAGVQLELTGKQITRLATKSRILSITPNGPVRVADATPRPSNSQLWPYVSGAAGLWPGAMKA